MSGEKKKKRMDYQKRERLTKVLNKYYQSQKATTSLHSFLPDRKVKTTGMFLSKLGAWFSY